jgi:hypothetical protein
MLLLGRNFEWFAISSSGLSLAYHAAPDRWALEETGNPGAGTKIAMRLPRTTKLRGAARARA